ncbi:hypothetical protein BG000_007661 [Podila horticola]|nr:hypothetical protein BG000_007661 [Podila horticola]
MTSSHSTLRAKGIGKKNADGSWLFRNVDIEMTQGVVTIAGPSGVGKSTLLKCINQTIVMDEGQLWLDDKTPEQWGIPTWRSRIMYIPQRTAVLEGTPLDFVEQVRSFAVHQHAKKAYADPVEIALDCAKVEKTLGQVNCIWVTHNPQQAKRISTAGQLNMLGGDYDGSQSPTPTPSRRGEVDENSHEQEHERETRSTNAASP